MSDEVKLEPWPFFGYAPGNYMTTCLRCGEIKSDLDKRAISCLECAVLASKEIGKDQRELIGQLSRTRPTIVTGQLEGELIRELVSFVEVIANARVDAMTGSIVLGNIGAPTAVETAKRLLAKLQPGGSNAHSE